MILIEILLFLLLCTLCQAGILRIWMDSYLFKGVQNWFSIDRDYGRFPFNVFGYLMTCWQCFGVWTGWFVVWALAKYIPVVPVDGNWVLIVLFGIAVGFLSDLLEYYVISPLHH